jgi:uncharacterized membrane protein
MIAQSMPNWLYLTVNALYHLGLALWIGGAVALGALVAPALFGALPRPQAGSIFGATLRRFARLRIAALAMILIGAAAKYLWWETHARTAWITIRWMAIAFLAFDLVYEIAFLERAMRGAASQAAQGEQSPAGEPAPRFAKLHRRAELLMKASLLAAMTALFFS